MIYPHGDLIPTAILAKIEETRVVVTHRSCADGFLSFLLLKDAFRGVCSYRALAHDREHEQLAAESGMLFCDMSPPAARKVLDHHASAKHLFDSTDDGPGLSGVYADRPGVSGAVLALDAWSWCAKTWDYDYDELWDLARLVGVYDTWQKDSPEWQRAREVTAAIHHFRRAVDETDLQQVDQAEILDMLTNDRGLIGRTLVASEDRAAKATAARAYRTEVVALGVERPVKLVFVDCGSDEVNHAADHVDDADIVCSVRMVHELGGFPRYRVSMRRRPQESTLELDLGQLAKRLGGGGHKSAAGFMLDNDERVGPYRLVRDALWRALIRQA